MEIKGQRVFSVNGVEFPANIRVYEISLKGLPGAGFAITRRGAYVGYDSSTFELFQGDSRFRPARWPDEGFSRNLKLAEDKKGIVLPPELYQRFAREPDLWIGAYWTADWAFETSRVQAMVATENKLIFDPLKAPQAIRGSFPFYVFNALSALTHPGDYVLDEAKQIVYAAAVTDSDTFGVGVERTLLEINGARNITLKGLKLDNVLGTALVIRNSENVTIDGCEIRHSGRRGILVDGGKNVVITHCRVDDTAETAIEVKGGDRKTLTPAAHVVSDNHVSHFGVDTRVYRSGIQVSGVGIRVENNIIEDSLHSAIIMSGNDHVIAGNEIRNVVREADDAGAIYTGRDWTDRGNLIRGNWFHDIGMPDAPGAELALGRKLVAGIYLDDQESGYTIENNVFDRVSRPVFIHGGRDNAINGNAFLRCGESAIFLARRGEGMTGGTLQQRLEAMPYDKGIWAIRYPALAKLKDDQPAEPLHNTESDNLAVGCPLFAHSPKTPAELWPDMGKTSRTIPDAPAKDQTTLEVLSTYSLGCEQFPVLCRKP
jgi:hypothetical protein